MNRRPPRQEGWFNIVVNKRLLGFGSLVLALALLSAVQWFRNRSGPPKSSGTQAKPNRQAEAERAYQGAVAVEKAEEQRALKFWKDDLEAEQVGRYVEELWDRLNRSEQGFTPLQEAFGTLPLALPRVSGTNLLQHQVRLWQFAAENIPWTAEQNATLLKSLVQAGWSLRQSEWRHVAYKAHAVTPTSVYWVQLQLENQQRQSRIQLSGDLEIAWQIVRSPEAPEQLTGVQPKSLRFTNPTLVARDGPPPFSRALMLEVAPPRGSHFIDPLIVTDLDGDHLPEILLTAANTLLRRNGTNFTTSQILPGFDQPILAAAVADIDRDGKKDLLVADRSGLRLWRGSVPGPFEAQSVRVWSPTGIFHYPQVLALGDIDGDGDLDCWAAQYKEPYTQGQMPRPFWDANDGYPGYLLVWDKDRFIDKTAGSGLEAKRSRRTYSASFIDLNRDGKLDLLNVSDFSGSDVYLNAGGRTFKDVTSNWLPERSALGMAHTFGNFNGDSHLDLLVIGMNAPVVDRLWKNRHQDPQLKQHLEWKRRLTHGNRHYHGQAASGFLELTNGPAIQTGWAWGASAADFDLDGDDDLYVVNGHSSNRSVRDYEGEFWRHDIYVGNSSNNAAANMYFLGKANRIRGGGASYGGYDINRFLLNDGKGSFIDTGFLFGIGLQEDCRNLVATDMDGDGDPDIVLTTYELYPKPRQTVQMFENKLASAKDWVGIRVADSGKVPILGTRLRLETAQGVQQRVILTGDSHRSQHPEEVRFAIGSSEPPAPLTLYLPGGGIIRTNVAITGQILTIQP